MFSNYYIVIEPAEYIWDQNGDGSVCSLLILANQYEFFILGQPFFQGYYAMHHMSIPAVEMSPLKDSGKTVPYKGTIPVQVLVGERGPSFIE